MFLKFPSSVFEDNRNVFSCSISLQILGIKEVKPEGSSANICVHMTKPVTQGFLLLVTPFLQTS